MTYSDQRAPWNEAGAALVEFVLVLPLVLVLLLGMLDLGKAFNYWIDENHLAHEGARFAAVNKNPGPGASLQESIKSQAETGRAPERASGLYQLPGQRRRGRRRARRSEGQLDLHIPRLHRGPAGRDGQDPLHHVHDAPGTTPDQPDTRLRMSAEE